MYSILKKYINLMAEVFYSYQQQVTLTCEFVDTLPKNTLDLLIV